MHMGGTLLNVLKDAVVKDYWPIHILVWWE
jgi:hypothetical protein